MTDHPHHPNPRQASTSAIAAHRGELIDRIAQTLLELGFEPTHVNAVDPESGVVDVVLSALRQMAVLLQLTNGWSVPAGKLVHPMVIDYGPMQRGDEPCVIEVQDVVPTGIGTGLVRIYGQDGFVSNPVAEDFPFELMTDERRALEESIVGAEQDRLAISAGEPGRHEAHQRNAPRRFTLHHGGAQ